MRDELERQLAAYGRTLSAGAERAPGGRPITAGSPSRSETDGSRRRWATLGAAACLVAGVAALVVVTRPDDVAPGAAPLSPTDAATTTSSTTTTSTTTTIAAPISLADLIADDPLGLVADGWRLVERTTEPFATDGIEQACPGAAGLTDFNGAAQVHDVLTPPTADGLDVDVTFVATAAGSDLATGLAALGPCIAESDGLDASGDEDTELGATWFRAGPQFALGTVVGEHITVILEIEGADFDDALIVDLVNRAATYLSTLSTALPPATIAAPPETTDPTTTDPTTTVAASPSTTVPRLAIATVTASGDQAAPLLADIRAVLVCSDVVTTPWPDSNAAETPADAFYAMLEAEAIGFDIDGRQHLPWSGWTELVLSPTASAFVHEADGGAVAVAMVNGIAETGQWYTVETAACRSALEPALG